MSDDARTATVTHDDADPQATPTLLVAAVGVALLVVVVLLLEVLYQRTAAAEQVRKVISEQPLELRSVQAEQTDRLSHYRWVDEKAGVAAIPIDRAMDLVVEQANRSAGRGGPAR